MREAGRHRQQWVAGWKEPHCQWGNRVIPHREQGAVSVKKEFMCSGKTCWLPAGYSARAVVRPWREAGGDVE